MNIGYHFELIRDSMRALSEENGNPAFSNQAIEVALLSNSYIDIFQEDFVEFIIDDTFCRLAKPVVECCHFDNLYHRDLIRSYAQQLVLNTLSIVEKSVQDQSPLHCLLAIGASLHIVNDLYAHSNWAELEMHRYLNKKDATYYDYLLANDDSLDLAVTDNRRHHMNRFEGEKYANQNYGFYTHGKSSGSVPTPIHDRLKKDFAGLPHFDWAYRAAYKASIQHLLIIQEHLSTVPEGTEFWESLASFSLPSEKANAVEKAVSFDQGTVRWFTIYGGAWKHGNRWSDSDIIVDNLPNTTGIGIIEQYQLPILGAEWLTMAIFLADGLFEAYDHNVAEGGVKAFSRQKYFQTLNSFAKSPQAPQEFLFEAVDSYLIITEMIDNFIIGLLNKAIDAILPGDNADTIKEIELYDPADSPLVKVLKAGSYKKWHFLDRPNYDNNAVITNALTALNGPLCQKYENLLKWIRIRVPYADDYDTGSGFWNLNNEEIGGTSDYWVFFMVGGFPYTEAEYVDKSHPVTNWQVLFPVFSNFNIPVSITMYESDPSDHKDETMDIVPGGLGGTKTLSFMIDSANGNVQVDNDLVEIIDWPTGSYLKSGDSGNLGASVRIIAGRMSDRRVEITTQLIDDKSLERIEDLGNSMAITGGYGWHLKRPIQKKKLVDHYTFDPGRRFNPNLVTNFFLNIVNIKNAHLKHAAARCENVKHACSFYINGDNNKIVKPASNIQVSNKANVRITAEQSEEIFHNLSVITITNKDNGSDTESPVYLSFYTEEGPNAAPKGHYRLTNFDRKPFEPGQADFFWLGKQKLNDFEAVHGYGGVIKNIDRIKIEKEAGDDLRLDRIAIYANGYLIAESPGQIHLTDANPSWEIEITFPKEVRWVDLPQVKCLGIKDIPGYPGKKGIAYTASGKLELIGYDADSMPAVELEMLPSSGPLANSGVAKSISEVSITSTIYINRHLNDNFSYRWKIDFRTDTETITKSAQFEIPRPFVEIYEQGFWGGEELVDNNGRPELHFTGVYNYDFHHYGTDDPEEISMQFRTSPRNRNHRNLQALKFILPNNPQEQWPYQTGHKLQLQAKDIYDISLEEQIYSIELPKLSAHCIIQHQNKICSYFSTQHRIIKKLVSDPDYDLYAGSYSEVRAEYEFVTITLVPYLRRAEQVFTYTVHEPTFSWKVPELLRCYKINPQVENPSEENPTKIQFLLETLAGKDFINPHIISDLKPILDGPQILVSLLHSPKLGSSNIECLITDAIGQKFNLNINLFSHTGMDLTRLGNTQRLLMIGLLIRRYSEHFEIMEWVKNGLMRDLTFPPLDIDPVEWETLNTVEKEFIHEINDLNRVYAHYGFEKIAQNPRLQKRVDRLLQSMDNKVEKIEKITLQRNSVASLENNIAILANDLQVMALKPTEISRIKTNVSALHHIIENLELN